MLIYSCLGFLALRDNTTDFVAFANEGKGRGNYETCDRRKRERERINTGTGENVGEMGTTGMNENEGEI